MNEQVQERAMAMLEKVINNAVASMEGVAEFAQEQLPDLIQQLLMWKMAESLIVAIFPLSLSIFFSVVFFKVVMKILNSSESRDNDNCAPYVPNFWWGTHGLSPVAGLIISVLIFACIVIFSLTLVTINIDWLYIMIAPKVYLLEYAAELVK